MDWTGMCRITRPMISRPKSLGSPDTKCVKKATRRSATNTATIAAMAKPLPWPVHSLHVRPNVSVYPSLQMEQSARGYWSASEKVSTRENSCCTHGRLNHTAGLTLELGESLTSMPSNRKSLKNTCSFMHSTSTRGWSQVQIPTGANL